MKINLKLFAAVFLTCFIGISSASAEHHGESKAGKPGRLEATITTLEAIVIAVDHDNRKVTLKGPMGNTLTIDVDDSVKNLAQVEVNDLVTVDHFEKIAIEVFSPGELEDGATTAAAVATTKPGEKPAALAMEETVLIASIEAIDLDNELVTLKVADGESKTFKPQVPENLKRVAVGDKVKITYTASIGISVTEK